MRPKKKIRTSQTRAEAFVSPEEFKTSVNYWAAKVRVKPRQIRLQNMTRKWGSCSTAGWITFSRDLLEEPKSFRDYVIVHELLHMKVPNHGKLFKSLLSAHLPHWKKETSLSRE